MKATGIKALFIGIVVLALVLAVFIIAINIFLILIPIIIILGIIGYLYRKISPRKPAPSESKKRRAGKYVDVEYKVKE